MQKFKFNDVDTNVVVRLGDILALMETVDKNDPDLFLCVRVRDNKVKSLGVLAEGSILK